MEKKIVDILIVRCLVQCGGEILLLRRSQTDKWRPGTWELPGGHVDIDESLEGAAMRELKEEAGIVVESVTFVESSQYIHQDGTRRLGSLFVVDISTKPTVTLSPEHDEWAWVDESNINNYEVDPFHMKVLERFGIKEEKLEQTSLIDDKITSKTTHAIVYTDGGSRGNPGPSASGYIIFNEKRQLLLEGGEYLGITTNNQAEYQAVLRALEECKKLGIRSVDYFIDSLLVVNQMKGIFQVKNRDLWPIHDRIKTLIKDFDSVQFTHVPREKNKLADAKVNEVLDNQAKRED